jgi:hypothetical protein
MMADGKSKTVDQYINRIEKHVLKRFPHLMFRVEKWSDREATIYYTPYVEEEDVPIIERVGGIATDAIVDSNIRIWIMPDKVTAQPQVSH